MSPEIQGDTHPPQRLLLSLPVKDTLKDSQDMEAEEEGGQENKGIFQPANVTLSVEYETEHRKQTVNHL